MRHVSDVEVSVVVPFGDDEDAVGRLCQRVARHLRALDRRFEILCVDEDSGDNSVALLALLQKEIPEIRILPSEGWGRGFAAGARVARGRVLWLLDASRAQVPLAPFAWAAERVLADRTDLVHVPHRFVVCRRTRTWTILEDTRGRGATFERRLIRAARLTRLRVESPPVASRRYLAPRRWLHSLLFP